MEPILHALMWGLVRDLYIWYFWNHLIIPGMAELPPPPHNGKKLAKWRHHFH